MAWEFLRQVGMREGAEEEGVGDVHEGGPDGWGVQYLLLDLDLGGALLEGGDELGLLPDHALVRALPSRFEDVVDVRDSVGRRRTTLHAVQLYSERRSGTELLEQILGGLDILFI